jgi:hypothetical protein
LIENAGSGRPSHPAIVRSIASENRGSALIAATSIFVISPVRFQHHIHLARRLEPELIRQLFQRGNLVCLRVELRSGQRNLEERIEQPADRLLFFGLFENFQKIRDGDRTARRDMRPKVIDNPRLRVRLL